MSLATTAPSAAHGEAAAVPLLDEAECWRRLPPALAGAGQPLPVWVRAIAGQLPRTAAAMLRLDLAQRTQSPLDPRLRAELRWVVAQANRCAYAQAEALADLARAGASPAELASLTGDPAAWSADDREPREFVRLLTLAAPTIPDALFERLRQRFGARHVAAMVLLAAYGAFQDRLLLGLQLPLEAGGPAPPLAVKFPPEAFQLAAIYPPQPAAAPLSEAGAAAAPVDPRWASVPYEALQSRLEQQRRRAPRLPVPAWEEVRQKLPPEMAVQPTRIVWNLVCSGYVPELAVPWSICTRTLWAETQPDRVFEESLFWVQTRTVGCNYCMGHCEMLLEVAGLSPEEVARRTQQLASSDWSAFPPAQQRAFAYARKLSETPWELTRADYATLERDWGPATALATFWWLCRGLYMTRVSDGFQLPLEEDNVFQDFVASAPAAGPTPLPTADELRQLAQHAPEAIERAYAGQRLPESVQMLLAILRGSQMGAGEGWFGPAESRFSWDWLARRHGLSPDEPLRADQFRGPAHWFARLDRNQDGQVTADELDWSEQTAWGRQAYVINRLFRRMDPTGAGRVSRADWQAFFERAAHGQEYLIYEDLRDALLAGVRGSFLPGDAPTQEMLLEGFYAGDVGSLQEGPPLDGPAPDFELQTFDGSRAIRLADLLGAQPVVLVFGNFTCGPFRSMYAGVDAVYERFKAEARFLGVYVREAHPTDGWVMESNARVGVAEAQPRTYAERVAVATRCQRLLRPSLPLVVDQIDDPVGNAYSGMPARLYVLDRTGRVAYKGGRGPFGFKASEMEQALVLALLEQATTV